METANNITQNRQGGKNETIFYSLWADLVNNQLN